MTLIHLGELATAVPGGFMRERTVFLTIVAYSWLIPFVAPAAWSWFRVGQRIWQRRWREPRWYARVLWTSLYSATCLVAWAAMSRGLTPNSQEANCRYAGQSFDSDYHYSHFGPLPPLLNSSPCNEHYDLVAAWINPAIVVLLLVTTAAAAALAAAAVHRSATTRARVT